MHQTIDHTTEVLIQSRRARATTRSALELKPMSSSNGNTQAGGLTAAASGTPNQPAAAGWNTFVRTLWTKMHELCHVGGLTAAASGTPNQPAAAGGRGGNVSVPTKIRKARQGLCDVDEGQQQQFTPVTVSIGAYRHHRGLNSNGKRDVADRVCPPRGTKWKLVRAELNQLTGSNNNGRGWYPDIDPSEMEDYFCFSATGGSGSSSRMPLLDDACYVLHFLVEYRDEEERDVVIKDPLREENENSVMRDILFLLENQVPWSVLRAMHRCIRSPDDRSDLDKQLADRVQKLLADRLYTISGGGEWWRLPVPSSSVHTHHLLHLVHHYLQPTKRQVEAAASSWVVNIACCSCNSNRGAGGVRVEEERRGRRMARWRRATEYRRYAFVQLKRREFKQGEVESVLDVRLQGGTLWIPTLRIDDLTCTLLRNLIAFEDRMGMIQRPVTAYCLFMSQLACKVEDVELLQRFDILQNFLPTDEHVVLAFANLCKGVVLHVDDPQKNYLNATWHELQKRCQTAGNTFFGLFLEKHCSNPVHTLAFIAAVLLFVFQAAQVLFALLSYLHRR